MLNPVYPWGSETGISIDDLRLRKIFNLGITKDISRQKLSKLEKLQNVVKYGKYSPAKLANLYTFVLCAGN